MTSDAPHEHSTQLRNHWWWRPGWREGREFYTWHLTFEGQTNLHRLVTEYQQALRDVPGLDLIPLEWLHLTVQGVGFTDEVTDHDIHAIADAATQRLSTLTLIELTFDQPAMRPEALVLPAAPTDALITVRDTIRKAIADVWGDTQVPETGNRFEPHLSLGYVNTDGPATSATTALASVKMQPARCTVSSVPLIGLRREGHLYRWRIFADATFDDRPPPRRE